MSTRIDGYASVAALKDAYEAAGAQVLLMDAGDFIQGSTSVNVSEGATAVELMNMAGYDVATTGNHEFDYGYANLKTLMEQAEFPILAANAFTAEGELAMDEANHTFQLGDVTVGVFGLATPETATKAHPAKLEGVTFLAEDELFNCAQEQVDELTAEGCDYIICLGHLASTLSPPATAPSTCWRTSPASTCSSTATPTPSRPTSLRSPTAPAWWGTPSSPPPAPSWRTSAWWTSPLTAPSTPPPSPWRT